MSIMDQAAAELKRINFGEEDSAVMLGIMRKFFDQWDSGGAVSVAAPVLARLIAGKPLSPLTGADDEWMDHGDGNPQQNVRASSVFREKDEFGHWFAYDIDRTPKERGDPIYRLPSGRHRYAIAFPYDPEKAEVSSPVVEFDTGFDWADLQKLRKESP